MLPRAMHAAGDVTQPIMEQLSDKLPYIKIAAVWVFNGTVLAAIEVSHWVRAEQIISFAEQVLKLLVMCGTLYFTYLQIQKAKKP